jgi:hypothetical protein
MKLCKPGTRCGTSGDMERKTPAKATVSQNTSGRWGSQDVLRTARARMRGLVNDNNVRIQEMLRALMVEAGWSEQDFLKALLNDIQENGRGKWMVPTGTTTPAPRGSLEGERRPSRPPPTRSGTMARVQAPDQLKHKKAGGTP